MVQFLSVIFFSWISSIFVEVFKSSRFFCVILYIPLYINRRKFIVIIKILCTKYAVITSMNDFSVYKLQHSMCDILMCARSWTDGQLAGRVDDY